MENDTDIDRTMKYIKRIDWDGNQNDWQWMGQDVDYFDSLVVQAKALVHSPDVDIVAVWLDSSKNPVYLVGRDRELYYHPGVDEILEQHFPALDFLRWRNSWEYPEMPFTATEPFPKGWRYMRCYPQINKTFILVREGLSDVFSMVVREHAYKFDYYVTCNFPALMEETLNRADPA